MASFAEWTEKEKKKQKKQLAEGLSFTDYTKQKLGVDDIDAPLSEKDDDIAPVVSKKEDERKWFQKGAFEDGYQFGDITKTILGIGATDKEVDNFDYDSVTQNKDFASKSKTGLNSFYALKQGAREEENKKSGFQKFLEFNAKSYSVQHENPAVTAMNTVAQQYREDTSYKEPTDEWTDEQKSVFGYLYAEDKERAWKYAEMLNNSINKEKSEKQKEVVEASATKHFGSSVGHTAASIILAPTGIADFADNLIEYANRGTITEKGMLTPFDYTKTATGGISEKLNEMGGTIPDDVPVIGGKGFGDLYSLGYSAAQSLTYGGFGSGAVMGMFFGQAGAAGVDEKLEAGGTAEQALSYGLVSGAAEAIAEKIGIDNLFKNSTAKTFKDLLKGMVKQGVSEGAEEGLTSVINNVADSVIMGDKSKYNKAVEEYEQFMSTEDAKRKAFTDILEGIAFDALGGMITGSTNTAVMTGAKSVNNIAHGKDGITGLTKNEQKIVDKEYQDRVAEAEENGKLTQKEKSKIYDAVLNEMEKGYISTDTIESVLGGETYKTYKDTIDSEDALQKEFDTLNKMKQGEMTGEQIDRRAELKQQLEDLKNTSQRDQLKQQLSDEVFNLAKDSRLVESYNEKARRGQAFEADLSKYDEKQRAVVQKAVESGILNNTNRTREFVDLVAKISADKGVLFDFTNNAKLKESGFAIDGKTVNGYVTKDGITVNMDSSKYVNSVVGHEITHVLEGTELYTELQKVLFDYAKSKNDYQGRYDSLTELYKGIEGANVDAELTADLVGDYLFTDSDFINRLSTEHRNVFEKIYDEIKYLYKVATAGSKEARELEKVKKAFEDAYRAQKNTATNGGVKFSLADAKIPTREELNKKSAVAIVDISKPITDGTFSERRAKIIGNIAETIAKPYLNKDTGSLIFLTKESYKHAFNNIGDTQLNAAEHLPELIENAVLTHGETITHGNEFATGVYTFFAAAYTGKVQPVKLKVKEYEYRGQELPKNIKAYFDNSPQGYAASYDTVVLEVVEIEESPTGSAKEQNQNDSFLSPDGLSEMSIADLLNLVNGDAQKFIPQHDVQYSIADSDGKQFKSVANEKPTADADIRFSLSEAVEETDKLVAAHNLQSSELLKSFELGGLPMPSIAITKANEVHDQYGDVTLILRKDAIDPKKSRYNKVYGGDAWTPTYPKIEYKPSGVVAKRISDKYYTLAKEVGYDAVRPMYRYVNELEETLNRTRGEAAMLEELYGDTDMMQVYLLDSGKGRVETIQKEIRTSLSDADVEMREFFINELGADVVDGVMAKDGSNLALHKRQYWKQHGEAIENAYSKLLSQEYGFTEEEVQNVLDSTSTFDYLKFVRDAYLYRKNGRETIKTEADRAATEEAIKKAAGEDYKAWVDNLFGGIEEKSGIRNNENYYTNSGNPRSWNALHWENTLENVVKVMRQQAEKGADTLFGGTGIWAVSSKDYNSIEEIKNDSHRLRKMSDEEYEAVKDSYAQRFNKIAEKIADKSERNWFIAHDNAMEAVVDAVRTYKTKAGILNELKQYRNLNVTEADVDDIVSLVNDIAEMPTGYFEAKPRRAVGFDEVGVFVIPYNADTQLKQELLNRGYAIAEYNPEIEGDRQKVVNQFEEYKFSLSSVGETPKSFGNYNVSGKDLLLEQEIAPVVETVSGTSAATVDENIAPDGFAPVSQEEVESLREDSFASLEDADMPPEVDMVQDSLSDAITIDKKSIKQLVRNVGDSLGLNRVARTELEQVMQEFSQNEYATKDGLFAEIQRRFSTQYDELRNDEVAAAKNYVKNAKISVSPTVKSEFGEAKDYVAFMRSNFGKIRFSKDGLGVDEVYQEAAELYPSLFPDDIANAADQLRRIAEVANTPVSELIPTRLPDDVLQDATDMIYDSIGEYKETERMIATDEMKSVADAHIVDFAPIGDKVVGLRESADTGIQEEAAPVHQGKDGQLELYEGATETETKKSRRQALHESILGDIKTRFEENGFDFDDVLAKAKDLSTFATVDNTPQRVMEKSLGYKEGQVLSDITVNKVAQNETEGIKWLNSFTDRKDGLLAQISKRYNIKSGSKESAAAQMYAEGFYVDENNEIIKYGDAELAADFPDANVRRNIKGLASDPRIRQIYDDTLAMINESRSRNEYPEIPRLDNYFLHFRAMEDTFSRLGLPFNPNDIRAKDLPTDLNGVTADLKPGQPYFASAMHRTGKRTSFDLLGGLERYLSSAKNQIYHIDDIQTLRALRNYIADTYGQAKGLEGLDSLSEEEVQERIKQVYGSHLSTFAKFLNEEANVLAGKTALIDRGLEGIIGRRGITLLDTINKQVGSNMVGMNVSSSLTNFLPVVQTIAKTNKFDFIKGFTQTVANKVGSIFGRTDGFTENSPVMIRRKGADRFYRTPYQKISDAGYVLMGAVDDISTEIIARTKYNELTRKGMDSQKAHFETDKWVSRLIGDRSLGQQPQIYNSKMLGLFTKFQLEVRNQLDSQFYDTIQEAKVSNEDIQNGLARNAKTAAKVTSTFVQLAVLQHLFGKAFESVAGYNPAFDIVEVLIKTFGWDDDEEDEDTLLDNVEEGFLALLEDLPYTSTFTGGRIPISSALPVKEFFTGKDQYGNEKSRLDTLTEAAPYYLMPTGYNQIKKTVKGLNMFDEDLPIAGSYTESGNLRFPVEDTPLSRIQAGVFGQWSSQNARDYFDNEWAPLKEKQTQEFVGLDIPIQEYREIRENLSELDKLEEKADYINSLDLPTDKKNLLINNIADRKEPIDMEDYGQYGSLEEFDFAEKNPEKYAVAKSVGGYEAYKTYSSELYDIKADKDEEGKSITGSRKEKVIEYVNNLDADYGTRIILFKSEYNADDTYNEDIIEYLNGREDISYEEMATILKELGFTVSSDGTITW